MLKQRKVVDTLALGFRSALLQGVQYRNQTEAIAVLLAQGQTANFRRWGIRKRNLE